MMPSRRPICSGLIPWSLDAGRLEITHLGTGAGSCETGSPTRHSALIRTSIGSTGQEDQSVRFGRLRSAPITARQRAADDGRADNVRRKARLPNGLRRPGGSPRSCWYYSSRCESSGQQYSPWRGMPSTPLSDEVPEVDALAVQVVRFRGGPLLSTGPTGSPTYTQEITHAGIMAGPLSPRRGAAAARWLLYTPGTTLSLQDVLSLLSHNSIPAQKVLRWLAGFGRTLPSGAST